ncbi:hypothetical protein GMMP15_660095 [Candidatus Magnetomoraceae bacterium gMMP-15]
METQDKPKLLLIEDDPDILESTKMLLSKHFDVDTSETIDDAISKLASNEYEVAIIDMAFPGDPEGGLRVCRYISQNNLSTKSIVLTGYGDVQNFRKALRYGIFDYIEKGTSFTNDTVLAAALEAINTSPKLTIDLSKKNMDTLFELRDKLSTDNTGAIIKGLKLLYWATKEWDNGWRILSEKNGDIKIYPNLLGD